MTAIFTAENNIQHFDGKNECLRQNSFNETGVTRNSKERLPRNSHAVVV